jgi:hypothetical protein
MKPTGQHRKGASKKRTLVLVAVAGAMVLLSLFLIFGSKPEADPHNYFSDPHQVRNQERLKETRRTIPEMPEFSWSPVKSTNHFSTNKEGRITLTVKAEMTRDNPDAPWPSNWAVPRSDRPRFYNYTVRELKSGGAPIQAGKGVIRLDWINVAYKRKRGLLERFQSPPDYYDVSAQFFRGSLQPFTAEELVQERSYQSFSEESYGGLNPSVRFAVNADTVGQVKFFPGREAVIDANTGRVLTDGYGAARLLSNESTVYLEYTIPMWHQAPVRLKLDLAHGPVKTFKVQPEVGEIVSSDSITLLISTIIEGECSKWRRESRVSDTKREVLQEYHVSLNRDPLASHK